MKAQQQPQHTDSQSSLGCLVLFVRSAGIVLGALFLKLMFVSSSDEVLQPLARVLLVEAQHTPAAPVHAAGMLCEAKTLLLFFTPLLSYLILLRFIPPLRFFFLLAAVFKPASPSFFQCEGRDGGAGASPIFVLPFFFGFTLIFAAHSLSCNLHPPPPRSPSGRLVITPSFPQHRRSR